MDTLKSNITTRNAILLEQLHYLRKNLKIALIGDIFAVSMTVSILWNVVNHTALLSWASAGIFYYLFSLICFSLKTNATVEETALKNKLRIMTCGALAHGLIWGFAILYFFQDLDTAYQLALMYALPLFTVAMISMGSAYYPLFIAGFLPIALAGITGLLIHGSSLYLSLAIATMVFTLLMIYFVRYFYILFNESIRLRFENTELLTEVMQQKDRAEEANQAKSRFLAAASHDLRQPIHALTLYLGTIQTMALPTKANTLLNNAIECSHLVDDLFKSLLEISHLDACVVTPEITVFPIAPILQRLHIHFSPEAMARGLNLRIVNSSAWVKSDPSIVERIMCNLVANAIRYTNKGTVLIGCRNVSGKIRLCVFDTGPGISKDHRQIIFEEFYQIGNPERDRSKGLGLGLAIVKKLSQLLSAPLTLSSQLNRGSMFSLDLSKEEKPALFKNKNRNSSMEIISTDSLKSLSGAVIMIIDDEFPILKASQLLLEQWGCKVMIATGREEAVDHLVRSKTTPDIIICDYRLRDNDNGVDVINLLREECNWDIPALLVTGDTGPEKTKEIQESGFPVVYKPLRPENLHFELSRLLSEEKSIYIS